MALSTLLPNQENVFSTDSEKTVYQFYNAALLPIHKARVDFKNQQKFIVYPYTVNRTKGEVKPKRIKEIEFTGWSDFKKLPKDFKLEQGYGLKSKRIKNVFNLIYPRFKQVFKISVSLNGNSRFAIRKISLNWQTFEVILKSVSRETASSDKDRKDLINNLLSGSSSKFSKVEKRLSAGDLESFLSKFDSFDKITKEDADSLAKIIDKLPAGKIITTSHFIKTRDKLDIVYLEDVINKFKNLLVVKKDNEEDWQKFFAKYSWIFTHLFPYQVILKKDKAYVGGKTYHNEDGRIVDFLVQNNLADNCALLEIKTHHKELLKKTPYRKPDVYSSSDELSGGISQCLDQKDSFIKNEKELEAYDPKSILVIGLKNKLSAAQRKCFELIRLNQKNVDIVTFDELLSKLEGFHKVITGEIKGSVKKKKGSEKT